ncbi:hypothetical protein EP331_15830 [bacterium]|nr:MAG: hypothetical protein EP331_15830 [bacterium]
MKSDFYSPSDTPGRHEKEMMWNRIELAVAEQRIRSIKSIHWKSFWFGCAASVLIVFSVIGLFTVFRSVTAPNPNSGYALDMTYERAMNQLVSMTPNLVKQADEVERPVLESKIKNIEDIDSMIEEIRNDMLLNGVSDIKRRQLKRLYALKMDHVKDLLLSDEVSM